VSAIHTERQQLKKIDATEINSIQFKRKDPIRKDEDFLTYYSDKPKILTTTETIQFVLALPMEFSSLSWSL
jgi:hypothetical protein